MIQMNDLSNYESYWFEIRPGEAPLPPPTIVQISEVVKPKTGATSTNLPNHLLNRSNDPKDVIKRNATEVLLQDYYYCMEEWVGRE